jgi:hypothetical protein
MAGQQQIHNDCTRQQREESTDPTISQYPHIGRVLVRADPMSEKQ